MTGFTNYVSERVLGHLTGSKTIFALPAAFLALFNTVGSDDGTGFAEPSGNNYSRVQVSGNIDTNNATAAGNNILHFASVPPWVLPGMLIYNETTAGSIPAATTVLSTTGTSVTMSANATGTGVHNGDNIIFTAFGPASSPGGGVSIISNFLTILFPVPSGSWGSIIGWGLYDDVAAGDLLDWDYVGGFDWQPCTINAASPGVFTAPDHGFIVADKVVFETDYGGTAPTVSAGNLTGLLTVAHATADTFDVTDSMSTQVNTSSSGNGMIRKVGAFTVSSGFTVSLAGGAPGALIITSA